MNIQDINKRYINWDLGVTKKTVEIRRNNMLTKCYDDQAGFFSNCTVSLYEIAKYIFHNKRVPDVDFSGSYHMYKKYGQGNIHHRFFKIDESITVLPAVGFLPRSLFIYKDTEAYKKLNLYIDKWFKPSIEVRSTIDRIIDWYDIDTSKTVGIFYRGTDKFVDIPEPGYAKYKDSISKLLETSNLNTILLQTDQQQFVDYISKEFTDVNIKVLNELSRTTTSEGIHFNLQEDEKNFHGICLVAICQILSECKYLVNCTGNMSRWIYLFRGSTTNSAQHIDAHTIYDLHD